MKQPAYYISLLEKKPKKRIIYSHVKYVGDKIHFINIDSKEEFIITKRELMLNLQVNDYDISKDPSYLK